jgi:hypothetical protein
LKRSWVLSCIEKGCELPWIDRALTPKIAKYSHSALAHEGFVTSTIEEILEAGAISNLPKRERTEVVSPWESFRRARRASSGLSLT